LTWDRNSNRTGETALGDLVADALRAATGADLALVNGGGIRAGLPANGVLPADTALRRPGAGYAAGPPFDIVFEDLRAVFPFGNRALTAAVTGAQLHAFLEHALAEYTGPAAGTGSFVQISGFRMVFDGAAAPGARVVSLSLEDGTPIPDEATASYTLSLPDYVWYGGTGHYGLVEASTAPPTVGAPLEEVLADYFQAQGEVTAATDGRIEIR
ncbi:MAG: 5'-nucleotidase C-terminal domain-containing protein, partial [Myxococcales bacterium]|nr:5'-nucleotidase C-terminal domain-containing protein [Myxococcales bacterium]